MKIHSIGNLGYPVIIKENRERNPLQNHKSDPDANHPKDPESRDQPEEEPGQEELDQAIEAFHRDAQTQENGLSATLSNPRGPGLKVVLKDCKGSVVRQFTGEEFLRLRQTASKDTRNSGKILDQKL